MQRQVNHISTDVEGEDEMAQARLSSQLRKAWMLASSLADSLKVGNNKVYDVINEIHVQ
jgi:hypothetical protein